MTDPALPPGLSRETTIRRDAEGRWFHEGDPVTNPAVARAFDRWVARAEDGRLCLRNEVNWAYVEIEGAPLFVRRVRLRGESAELELSDERTEPLDPRTLRQGPDGRLYCTVRQGSLAALLTRRATFDLAERVGEDENGVFVDLAGDRIHPPVWADPVDGG